MVGNASTRGKRLSLQGTFMTAGPGSDMQRPESELSALRAENEILRAQLALRDQALDGTSSFFVITRQEQPVPIIVYCNKVVADQHGYSRAELIGKPITNLTQWMGRNSGHLAEAQAALRAGRTFQYEDEVTRRDGSTFWLGVSIRPLYDAAGSLSHSVA